MEVFAAVAGDGVHDGAAFALAFVAVVLEVEFGVGEGGGGEEEEADGCQEEDWGGQVDHGLWFV